MFLDFFNLAERGATHARGAGQCFPGQGRRGITGAACLDDTRFESSIARARRRRVARRNDLFLAQGQHAALEIRYAAPPEMIVDHPEMNIVHRLKAFVLNGIERDAMLLADAVAIMSVDQQIAPQHQRVAASLGQQAAFQSGVFVFGQRIDIGAQVFVDRNIHGSGGKKIMRGSVRTIAVFRQPARRSRRPDISIPAYLFTTSLKRSSHFARLSRAVAGSMKVIFWLFSGEDTLTLLGTSSTLAITSWPSVSMNS